MKVITKQSDNGRMARVADFHLLGRKVRVGCWDGFSLTSPVKFRFSGNPKFRGWQLDFFWFSLAVFLGRAK